MSARTDREGAMPIQSRQADLRTRLQDFIPKIVLAPSLAVILVFVYRTQAEVTICTNA